jgi:hypothetical protein
VIRRPSRLGVYCQIARPSKPEASSPRLRETAAPSVRDLFRATRFFRAVARRIPLRRVPAPRMPAHTGSAATVPARSANSIANHMCEHIYEPIHLTGRLLPAESGITMCAENSAYGALAS